MKAPTIGSLRHRLVLEAISRTADGGGGAIETWMSVAEIWGSVRAHAGQEAATGDGVEGRVTHEVWIRFTSEAMPSRRFREGARVFDVRAVLDPDGRRRWLRCLCEERVA